MSPAAVRRQECEWVYVPDQRGRAWGGYLWPLFRRGGLAADARRTLLLLGRTLRRWRVRPAWRRAGGS